VLFRSLKLTPGNYLFLLLMLLVMVAVTWIGILAYEEGSKTEGTKRNGEAWATWMTEASAKRLDPDYGIAACAGGNPHAAPTAPVEAAAVVGQNDDKAVELEKAAPAPTTAEANTWGACVEYLQTESALKDLRNPFTGEVPKFEAACNSDYKLAGSIVLEKLVPTPAGSSSPFVVSQLVASDPIGAKIQIRLTVCDKGGYGLKVSEFEF
jgi:hypothetical protein